MSIQILTNEQSSYNFYVCPDRHLVDPVQHFKELRQGLTEQLSATKLMDHSFYKTLSIKKRFDWAFREKAMKKQMWNEEYERASSVLLPDNILALLQETKKKKQQKLLKGFTYKQDMFMSIPIQAWNLFKMPYSRYTVDYLPKELKDKKRPQMIHMHNEANNDFTLMGETDMSESDLRLAIKKRHRVIMEFIGDEDYWHCFFRTMSSIRGVEEPHIGEPHLHYISSAWGMSRQNVIDNLSSYRYKLKKTEHIPFELPILEGVRVEGETDQPMTYI
jgi:hypothetical protein